MQIDLHGFCLDDAVEEVIWKLKEIVASGQNKFYLIHGYRNGQVLKNYFQSEQFLLDMKPYGFSLKPKVYSNNPGLTCFKIKSNIDKNKIRR